MKNNPDGGTHPEKGEGRSFSGKSSNQPDSDVSEVSEGFPEHLDRAAAFAILGLDETANAYAVDNRFWQLTKRYRAENNAAKLEEVTAAYEVASGRAAEKLAEQIADKQSKKYFGKSAPQWKVYFYYTWWKILSVVVGLILIGSFVWQIFNGGNYDISIVGVGHFSMDNTYLTKYAKEELGCKNPYITSSDLIADGSEPQSSATVYGPATAAAFLSANPDVIITDARTMPYYLPSLGNMDNFYSSLTETLPDTLLDKITPVYYSVKQYQELTAEEGDEISVNPEDAQEHIYGLQIDDPSFYAALGFLDYWAAQEHTLVFSVSANSLDAVRAENFILSIMQNLNKIIDEYNAAVEADTTEAS